MTELKTLKDFNGYCITDEKTGKHLSHDNIPRAKIRAEAIKWIKKIRDMPFIQIPTSELTPVGYSADIISKEGIEDIIWFIKYFFNITEEDLKKELEKQ